MRRITEAIELKLVQLLGYDCSSRGSIDLGTGFKQEGAPSSWRWHKVVLYTGIGAAVITGLALAALAWPAVLGMAATGALASLALGCKIAIIAGGTLAGGIVGGGALGSTIWLVGFAVRKRLCSDDSFEKSTFSGTISFDTEDSPLPSEIRESDDDFEELSEGLTHSVGSSTALQGTLIPY